MVIPAHFVADASFTLPWAFLDERTPETEAVWNAIRAGEATISVPGLWSWEIVNALLVNERRGRITLEQVTAFLGVVGDLPLRILNPSLLEIFESLPALARKHSLTAYDATYLLTALRVELPLATFDDNLANAARAEGVRVIGAKEGKR